MPRRSDRDRHHPPPVPATTSAASSPFGLDLIVDGLDRMAGAPWAVRGLSSSGRIDRGSRVPPPAPTAIDDPAPSP
jgi:hypothetical protein